MSKGNSSSLQFFRGEHVSSREGTAVEVPQKKDIWNITTQNLDPPLKV